MYMKNQNGSKWVSVIYVLFLLLPQFTSAQQILQVGAGEYCTIYRTSNERVVLTRLQGSTFAPVDLGLTGIKQVHGGQYTATAISATGSWIIGERNPQLITPILDSARNPFVCDYIHCIYQSNLFIKNGKIWYQGIDDVLNQNNGVGSSIPKMLINPAGKTFVKIVSGSATTFGSLTRMWALATDGTIWQWDRTRTSPVQVIYSNSLSDPARDIAMLGANAEIIETNSGNFWVKGYLGSYAGGIDFSSSFTNVKNNWLAAGVVFPTKEIATNYNTIHIIDANGNHFASGSNVQGNIGNGKQMNPWRNYTLYGNASPYQWGFDNFQVMQTPVWIPGKIKNITSSNTVAFYFYAQDEMNNWYSWGRNKSRCLGNGITMNAIDEAQRADYINVPAPIKVTPLTQTWTILPSVDINAARFPLANAGIDQLVTTDTTTLYGLGSSQQGSSISSYIWSQVSGPTCTIVSPNSMNTKISGITAGTYVFRLTVINSNSASSTSDVTIVRNGVVVPNQLPTANAGNNQTITLPLNSVTLTGSGTDTDGTITAYTWTKIAGPASGTITNASAAQTTFTGLTEGIYKIQLRVTDNSGGVSFDTVAITVLRANVLPVANAGNNQTITLPVNSVTLTGSGTDADGTIVSFSWTKIAGPATFTISNANAAQTTVTALLTGTYSFSLTVTDNNGGRSSDTVQVIVNPAVNIIPTAFAGSNQIITLPVNSVTLTGSGTDIDGTISTYNWVKISGPSSFIFSNANAAQTMVNNLVAGTYIFRLIVTDDDGATASSNVSVLVNPEPNTAPVANAGNNQTITLPDNEVTLTGTATDADGTIASYGWTKISGPATFAITNANAAQTTVTNLIEGVYSFRFTVADNDGATASSTVTVTVNPAPNVVPVANAGNNQMITLPVNFVTLSGSGTDTDGTIVSYSWTQTAGPATFLFTNANAAQTTVTNLVQGNYTFLLTVTDNSGATATSSVAVIVHPPLNILPVANAGSNQTITLPVNTVTLSGRGTDADGTIVSYSWTKISGPANFDITSANSARTTVTNLIQGTYTFRLTVTDNSGATASSNVSVIVNRIPNVVPVANAGNDQTITLPVNTVTLTGTGTDADGTIVSYAWTKISGPATFTISNANAAQTTVTNLTVGTYTFRLVVTDNDGATASSTVSVTVNPVPNIAPVANAGNDQIITLPTNSVTLTGSGRDVDGTIVSYNWRKTAGPSSSNITNTNSARTIVTDLTEGEYTFLLTVTDNAGATATSSVDVTVYRAPNVAPSVNAGDDTTIVLPTNSVVLTGNATDTDGSIASYNWNFISGAAASFDNTTSSQTTLSGLTEGFYSIVLMVTDNEGAISSDTVTVTVLAPVNIPPVANGGLNRSIIIPVTSTTLSGSSSDEDGFVLSNVWRQISGPTNSIIISPNTVTTAVSGLTVEGFYYYELTVIDNDGAESRDTVKVSVAKFSTLNILPVANAGTDQDIYLPATTTTLNGSATDADGWIVAYRWSKLSGPAGSKFVTPSSPTTRVTGLTVGTYAFVLAVADNRRGVRRDTMIINVLPQLTGRSISNNNAANFATDLQLQDITMSIWPMPATTEMNVQINGLESFSSFTATLVDVSGNIVYNMMAKVTASTMQISIPVSNLRRGTYFLRIYSNGKHISSKVLKM